MLAWSTDSFFSLQQSILGLNNALTFTLEEASRINDFGH